MGVKFLGGMHMSNNQLTKSDEVKYVPKLRFTEFNNDEGWEYQELSKISKFVNEKKSILSFNIENYVSTENLLPDFSGVNNAKQLPKEVNVTYFRECDILFSNIRPYLKKIWLSNKNGGASNDVIVLRAQKYINPSFLFFHLANERFIKYVMKAAKGVKMPRGDIEQIKSYPIFLTSSEEQQKVSACLSSLDELIQNESSKLEAYKQHKDGLLQQLFPKNGGSLPSLRFDEFSEEWANIELSKIAKPVKKKNTDQDKILVLSLSNEYGLVSQVDYFQKKIAGDNTDKYIVLQKNDFVYNDRITKNSTYGTIKRLSLYEEGIVSPIYKCFRFEKNQNPVFWEYFFESKSHENEIRQIINEGARAGRYNISTDNFLSINVMQPSHLEQEKIASCLTSLDKIITNQSEYIDQLKKHKKGLMQQLFPAVEETSA